MKYSFLTEPPKPKTAVVITPTIGSSKVKDAIASVKSQTYAHVEHLVVVDGPQYNERFVENFEEDYLEMINHIVLPFNTGHGSQGFYGHRIYSAFPHLVDHDYIFFLDDDNWFQPNHVETLIETIEKQSLDFAYSLRSIHDPDKTYVIDDNCEALGKWPIYFTNETPEQHYLVDTSSYAFRKDFLIQVSQLWHSGWGGDRRFFNLIRQQTNHNNSGKRTLCYRLDGNPSSVNADFFAKGNKYYENYYKGDFPWLKI